VRFDEVYHGHFKCNRRRIVEYPNIWAFTRELYQLPGVAGTVDMEHIKRHYYESHRTINPTGIVPVGPAADFAEPHGRDALKEDTCWISSSNSGAKASEASTSAGFFLSPNGGWSVRSSSSITWGRRRSRPASRTTWMSGPIRTSVFRRSPTCSKARSCTGTVS